MPPIQGQCYCFAVLLIARKPSIHRRIYFRLKMMHFASTKMNLSRRQTTHTTKHTFQNNKRRK